MNGRFSKGTIIFGSFITLSLVLGLILFASYHQKQNKEKYIKEFDELGEVIKEKTTYAEQDAEKSRTFINNHLPQPVGYLIYGIPIDVEVKPEYLTTYYLEESLFNKDVSTWISYFTTAASKDIMNKLKGKTLEEREKELLAYVERMTRKSKLTNLTCYKSANQFYLLFHYSDGIKIEVPVNFSVLQEDEVIVNTSIISIIKKIEKTSESID